VNNNTLVLVEQKDNPCPQSMNTLEPAQTVSESKTIDLPELKRAEYIERIDPVKRKLYNFINKSMNFNPDGDDIYQEALLKGFKYFHSYNPERAFTSWLFTIANNLIKDYYRKNRSELPLESDQISDGVDQDRSLMVTDIYHAVGELKPHHRRIFFLFYYNEFKITEISNITGLSQSNIKFILAQSRKRLKKYLEVPE
jgi:RNA polymerase sigma-70 factor (ECF subfamily)